jgi:hypothetical protein
MAERIVDALELVDVDIHHGQLLTRPDRLQRLLQPFAEQHAVRQIGQRIVMRHMGNLLVGAGALRYVLDRRHPSALWQRLVDDLDRAPTGRLGELTRPPAERHVADNGIAELVDVAIERAGLLTVRNQPLHRAARPGHVGREAEHVDVGLVADDDARRRVVEDQSLRNVVHGGREVTTLDRKPLVRDLMPFQHQEDNDGQDHDGRHQQALALAPACSRASEHATDQHARAEGKPLGRAGVGIP